MVMVHLLGENLLLGRKYLTVFLFDFMIYSLLELCNVDRSQIDAVNHNFVLIYEF